MKIKLVTKIMISIAVFVIASSAMATPVVDANLSPDDEYPVNSEMDGNYSKTYSEYVIDDGFYILNDWYKPVENFDPNEGYACDPNDPACEDPNETDGCDGYNVFEWTDTEPNPDVYWKIMCHGNGEGTVKKKKNAVGEPWIYVNLDDPNDPNYIEGFETAAGYNTSKNEPDNPHPIWEIKIPYTAISANIEVGMIDPKEIDPNDCPSTSTNIWRPTIYGKAAKQEVPEDADCD